MRHWTNYNRLIASILSFKRYFPNVKIPKYDSFIKVVSKYECDSLNEWDDTPTSKELAKKLGIPSSKVNNLVKGLYMELLGIFSEHNPVEINRITHQIYISLPYEERRAIPNREYAEQQLKRITQVSMKLPFTPRIGEHIDLSFIDDKKFTKGYVHDVRHVIMGDSQKVIIECHPYDHYYYKWDELKKDYEMRQRRTEM